MSNQSKENEQKIREAALNAKWNAPRVWERAALCAETGTTIEWVPDSITEQRALTKICQMCPVRKQCLSFALETEQCHGVWGGMTERQLRRAGSLTPQGNRQERPGVKINCPWCSSSHVKSVGPERLECQKCQFEWPGLITLDQTPK